MKVYTRTKRTLRLFLLRRLQPCSDVVPLMSDSLERRLRIGERISLRLHLLVCTWCVRYLMQIKSLRNLLHNPQATEQLETANAEKLSAAARERIARALSQTERSG